MTVIGGSTVFTLHIDLKPTSRNMVYFSVKNGCSKLLLNFVENAPLNVKLEFNPVSTGREN